MFNQPSKLAVLSAVRQQSLINFKFKNSPYNAQHHSSGLFLRLRLLRLRVVEIAVMVMSDGGGGDDVDG